MTRCPADRAREDDPDRRRDRDARTGPDRRREPDGSAPRDLRGWDALVERRIRGAMEAGAFEGLPFRGERLPPDEPGAYGVAGRILRREGVAPPWIEADKALRALLVDRDAILQRAPRSSMLGRQRDRAAIERIVTEVNGLVLRLEQEAPTPAQHRRRLVLAEELARLEDAWRSGRLEPG